MDPRRRVDGQGREGAIGSLGPLNMAAPSSNRRGPGKHRLMQRDRLFLFRFIHCRPVRSHLQSAGADHQPSKVLARGKGEKKKAKTRQSSETPTTPGRRCRVTISTISRSPRSTVVIRTRPSIRDRSHNSADPLATDVGHWNPQSDCLASSDLAFWPMYHEPYGPSSIFNTKKSRPCVSQPFRPRVGSLCGSGFAQVSDTWFPLVRA